MYSLIIPVYKNEGSIPSLVDALIQMAQGLKGKLEVVFVVDGSPDQSFLLLRQQLSEKPMPFTSQLIALSRNFGSFAAIKAGLTQAKGDYFAVMAADLQEPPELIAEFFKLLSTDNYDITLGTRTARNDPWLNKCLSNIFWKLYQKLIIRDMPKSGIDIFGCNELVRKQIIELDESHSSLVGLLMWVGFRRKKVDYVRLPRQHGKSAWSFRSKLKYLSNSIFAFSNLPIRIISALGFFSVVIALVLGLLILYERLFHHIVVPGYAAITLTILFFTGINIFCMGLIGSYVWRTYENSKNRPQHIIMSKEVFNANEN